jgi:hypothetical protein
VKFNKNYLSWKTIKACVFADIVTLRIFGDEHARRAYKLFSAPHPQFPLIPTKSLGAALLRLEGSYSNYYDSKLRRLAKRKLKFAIKQNYSYGKVAVGTAMDQIMAINRSMPVRGGHPMDAEYLDQAEFEAALAGHDILQVVRSPEGRIVAYALVLDIGDLWVVEHVVGHGDHLKNGIMYLLMVKLVEEKFDLAHSDGRPTWIMYDTVLGAPDGRRQFKRMLGFSPYWVRWRWGNAAPVPA